MAKRNRYMVRALAKVGVAMVVRRTAINASARREGKDAPRVDVPPSLSKAAYGDIPRDILLDAAREGLIVWGKHGAVLTCAGVDLLGESDVAIPDGIAEDIVP